MQSQEHFARVGNKSVFAARENALVVMNDFNIVRVIEITNLYHIKIEYIGTVRLKLWYQIPVT